MAQSEGFKHITVTAADDDDVVIVAGAVEAPANGAGDELAEAQPPARAEQSGAAAPSEAADSHAGDASAADSPKPSAPKTDSFHETTLEDLKQEPMPLAQRVVIIAAIVCIIGAVIYYLAFMR